MQPEYPAIMTIEEVAELLKLHPLTVRRLAREGEIPAFKVGRQWRIKTELLDRWIKERSLENLTEDASAGDAPRDTVP
jgi:excisionase family DNA binding protein